MQRLVTDMSAEGSPLPLPPPPPAVARITSSLRRRSSSAGEHPLHRLSTAAATSASAAASVATSAAAAQVAPASPSRPSILRAHTVSARLSSTHSRSRSQSQSQSLSISAAAADAAPTSPVVPPPAVRRIDRTSSSFLRARSRWHWALSQIKHSLSSSARGGGASLSQKQSFISSHPLLSSLPREKQTSLCNALRLMKFERGQTIYKQGEYPFLVYFLLEGSVQLSVSTRSSAEAAQTESNAKEAASARGKEKSSQNAAARPASASAQQTSGGKPADDVAAAAADAARRAAEAEAEQAAALVALRAHLSRRDRPNSAQVDTHVARHLAGWFRSPERDDARSPSLTVHVAHVSAPDMLGEREALHKLSLRSSTATALTVVSSFVLRRLEFKHLVVRGPRAGRELERQVALKQALADQRVDHARRVRADQSARAQTVRSRLQLTPFARRALQRMHEVKQIAAIASAEAARPPVLEQKEPTPASPPPFEPGRTVRHARQASRVMRAAPPPPLSLSPTAPSPPLTARPATARPATARPSTAYASHRPSSSAAAANVLSPAPPSARPSLSARARHRAAVNDAGSANAAQNARREEEKQQQTAVSSLHASFAPVASSTSIATATAPSSTRLSTAPRPSTATPPTTVFSPAALIPPTFFPPEPVVSFAHGLPTAAAAAAALSAQAPPSHRERQHAAFLSHQAVLEWEAQSRLRRLSRDRAGRTAKRHRGDSFKYGFRHAIRVRQRAARRREQSAAERRQERQGGRRYLDPRTGGWVRRRPRASDDEGDTDGASQSASDLDDSARDEEADDDPVAEAVWHAFPHAYAEAQWHVYHRRKPSVNAAAVLSSFGGGQAQGQGQGKSAFSAAVAAHEERVHAALHAHDLVAARAVVASPYSRPSSGSARGRHASAAADGDDSSTAPVPPLPLSASFVRSCWDEEESSRAENVKKRGETSSSSSASSSTAAGVLSRPPPPLHQRMCLNTRMQPPIVEPGMPPPSAPPRPFSLTSTTGASAAPSSSSPSSPSLPPSLRDSSVGLLRALDAHYMRSTDADPISYTGRWLWFHAPLLPERIPSRRKARRPRALAVFPFCVPDDKTRSAIEARLQKSLRTAPLPGVGNAYVPPPPPPAALAQCAADNGLQPGEVRIVTQGGEANDPQMWSHLLPPPTPHTARSSPTASVSVSASVSHSVSSAASRAASTVVSRAASRPGSPRRRTLESPAQEDLLHALSHMSSELGRASPDGSEQESETVPLSVSPVAPHARAQATHSSSSISSARTRRMHARHPSLAGVERAYTFREGHSDRERAVASAAPERFDLELSKTRAGRLDTKRIERQREKIMREALSEMRPSPLTQQQQSGSISSTSDAPSKQAAAESELHPSSSPAAFLVVKGKGASSSPAAAHSDSTPGSSPQPSGQSDVVADAELPVRAYALQRAAVRLEREIEQWDNSASEPSASASVSSAASSLAEEKPASSALESSEDAVASSAALSAQWHATESSLAQLRQQLSAQLAKPSDNGESAETESASAAASSERSSRTVSLCIRLDGAPQLDETLEANSQNECSRAAVAAAASSQLATLSESEQARLAQLLQLDSFARDEETMHGRNAGAQHSQQLMRRSLADALAAGGGGSVEPQAPRSHLYPPRRLESSSLSSQSHAFVYGGNSGARRASSALGLRVLVRGGDGSLRARRATALSNSSLASAESRARALCAQLQQFGAGRAQPQAQTHALAHAHTPLASNHSLSARI